MSELTVSSLSIDDVNAIYPEDRKELYRIVAEMFLSMFVKISGTVRAQQDSNNFASQTTILAIMPHKIYALRPCQFFDVFRTQKDRLSSIHNAGDLIRLEKEFCNFRKHISSSEDAHNNLFAFKNCRVKGGEIFTKAWALFCKRFKKRTASWGDLATVFPGTATVECDFSKINLEKNDYHSNLTDLSLDGILQSKQFGNLKKLEHS